LVPVTAMLDVGAVRVHPPDLTRLSSNDLIVPSANQHETPRQNQWPLD
jgi:hypothetical protein